MTRQEWGKAFAWTRKQQGSYIHEAASIVHAFAGYEMGKPRPDGTWEERLNRWLVDVRGKKAIVFALPLSQQPESCLR